MSPKHFSRRQFIETLGISVAGTFLSPMVVAALTGRKAKTGFGNSEVWAAEVPALGRKNKALVLIIQRGAMDGLSLIAPLGDSNYQQARRSIGLNPKSDLAPIRLDDHFSMHPAFSPLKSFWDQGSLAFVHQCGPSDPTRSHFDAQDYLESGTPGYKATQDGFLNRALKMNSQVGTAGQVRAVALQPSMPRVLQGAFPAVSMGSLNEFGLHGGIHPDVPLQGFETMYAQAADRVMRGVAQEAFDGLRSMDALHAPEGVRDLERRGYTKAPIARRLADISEMIRANIGLQVAVTDMGGWDTHINQGNEHGQLADRFSELSSALAAFAKELGPRFEDVCVVCVTEFGRTVNENGTRGTDHGHGSVATLLGGPIRGRKIYGQWTDLKPANLFEGRDLPVTTDLRTVFHEVLTEHLGWKNLASVFPKLPAASAASLGLIHL